MATSSNPTTPSTAITFNVPGQRQASRSGGAAKPLGVDLPGRVKDSVRVSARRSGGESTRVSAVPGQDVVVLRIDGGPMLVLHPETARDLMLGQGTAKRSAVAPSDAVDVPAVLRWQGLEQATPLRSGGFLGDVLLAGFDVITDLFKDKAVDFVAGKVVDYLDGQITAGVYPLTTSALRPFKPSGAQPLKNVPAAAKPEAQPLLVLIHGTFVETSSTFGKLWDQHPALVGSLFTHYGNRVYALDHPTVGVSPIANALTLVEALPTNARLHLVTHSRGGLVAEVLARMAGQGALSDDDLECFADRTVTKNGQPETQSYQQQRTDLAALAKAVRDKNIRVDRVVRVACPAHGTLLASKRLDAYLSVLKWTLELAGLPVVPALLDFLTAVAQERTDPQKLPGMAAMIADAPVLNWLNSVNADGKGIPGDLRVVAGDLKGDSISGWVKTLLADAYYWTDNDIVVQTRSMYGGSPRANGASYLLDQSGQSTHFNYFANERTATAVVNALTQTSPEGFNTIGPLSWRGEDSSGQRGARRSAGDGTPARDKPAVFVLPGILGSNLKAGDKRIWLSLRLIGGLKKLKYEADNGNKVLPDGPIGMVYDDLVDHLAQTHDVQEFAFDWRRPIEEEATRLADAVEAALDLRNDNAKPVRILAHSMGGVLARTMLLKRPKTFKRLMDRDGARFVMLGTPNGGSWAPMQVLSGDDTFGNALASFGSPLRDREARQLMAEMPGFLQLQAQLLDPKMGLDRSATWADLAKRDLEAVQQSNWWHRSWGETDGNTADPAYQWGVPPQDVLDKARALRLALDAQLDTPSTAQPGPANANAIGKLRTYADKMALVVGKAKLTPVGYEWTDKGLVYLNVTDTAGDGRVPLDSAVLPGVRTWTLDCEHGSLPDARRAFDAYVELLTRGDTQSLPRLESGAQRSQGATAAKPATLVRSRPARARPAALPAAGERDVLAASGTPLGAADSRSAPPLQVRVLNGNLSFVTGTLMIGHTRALQLTGTEKVVNRLIGGTMRESLNAGLYPDATGSHQLFLNRQSDPMKSWNTPQPARVVVVGLGEEGKLTERELTHTVRQGVMAWAQRMAEGTLELPDSGSDSDTPDPAAAGAPAAMQRSMELAATLMGSGGAGMSASTAARAIAQGVREANERIAATGDITWPRVRQLTLVELYLERASDAWQGLKVLQAAAPDQFDTASTIQTGVGPLRRQIDSGYRGTDYDFISATSPDADTISFRLDTKRARTEITAQQSQGKLLRELVKRASSESNTDPQLGRSLFQLLVPMEVEPFLAGTSRMLLELDDKTAAIPWELLDTQGLDRTRAPDELPWAIRTRLLRKLQMESYRQQVLDAQPDDAVLVIGEPKVDPALYVALPGARNEAIAVRDALLDSGGLPPERVVALIDNDDASRVINALFAKRYRIVHVAGHGEPIKRNDKNEITELGGVVLSEGVFLGPNEITAMRTVPELVFVNCCHLAARDSDQALRGGSKYKQNFNRAEFAMGVADRLISIGVRCVIAAGWAVDDEPAKVFADTFYRCILQQRQPFIDAVAEARKAAWNNNRDSNTWAAYQAYGDPDWVYRRGPHDSPNVSRNSTDEFENVSSPLGLALALEELAVRVKWMGKEPELQLPKVKELEQRFGPQWGAMGAVAEAFGFACAECKDASSAISWYRRAMDAEDGSASMKAHEQWGNLMARRGGAVLNKPQASLADRAKARKDIQAGLDSLEGLAKLQPTLERHSLCGSAHKRLAQLDDAAAAGAKNGNKPRSGHWQKAADAYRAAEQRARQMPQSNLFYPLHNRLTLEWLARRDDSTWPGFSATDLQAMQASLKRKNSTDPDFWSMVGQAEFDMLLAVQTGQLALQQSVLRTAFERLRARANAGWAWASVADQADLVLKAYEKLSKDDAEKDAAKILQKLLRGFAG